MTRIAAITHSRPIPARELLMNSQSGSKNTRRCSTQELLILASHHFLRFFLTFVLRLSYEATRRGANVTARGVAGR